MHKKLQEQDLSLNQLIDLIDSRQIYQYCDWNSYLINRVKLLTANEMFLFEKTLNNNPDLMDFVTSQIDLPEVLWAKFSLQNGDVCIEIENPPYNFITVEIPSNLLGLSQDLQLEQRIQIYKRKNNLSKYDSVQESESESLLIGSEPNKILAACLIAFSLQLPSSLSAMSDVHSEYGESQNVQNLLTENYETLQKTKNKKFIPLLKSMYKINELSSKINFNQDSHIDSYEKEQMVQQVSDMINSFYKNPKDNSKKIAKKIIEVSKKRDIDYRIFLSIIKEESDFNQDAYNPSGDYSVAQINYKIWSEEFSRLNKKPINLKKLKTDSDYSLDLMGEILSLIKKNSVNDPLWYAKYHSKTPKRKLMYAQKIHKNLKVLNEFEKQELQNSIFEYNVELARVDLGQYDFIEVSKFKNLSYELSSLIMNADSSKIAYNDEFESDN